MAEMIKAFWYFYLLYRWWNFV